MTIGPEPMTRTFLISLFSGIAVNIPFYISEASAFVQMPDARQRRTGSVLVHHIEELVKQEGCIAGTTAGLRMELHGECGDVLIPDALAGLVVDVDEVFLGDRIVDARGHDCVAVVLARDV